MLTKTEKSKLVKAMKDQKINVTVNDTCELTMGKVCFRILALITETKVNLKGGTLTPDQKLKYVGRLALLQQLLVEFGG